MVRLEEQAPDKASKSAFRLVISYAQDINNGAHSLEYVADKENSHLQGSRLNRGYYCCQTRQWRYLKNAELGVAIAVVQSVKS